MTRSQYEAEGALDQVDEVQTKEFVEENVEDHVCRRVNDQERVTKQKRELDDVLLCPLEDWQDRGKKVCNFLPIKRDREASPMRNIKSIRPTVGKMTTLGLAHKKIHKFFGAKVIFHEF